MRDPCGGCEEANQGGGKLSSYWAFLCLVIALPTVRYGFVAQQPIVVTVISTIAMLICCAYLVAYFMTNVVGGFYSHYKDADGVDHRHLGKPQTCDEVYCDKQKRPISGAILQTPFAGWGRNPKILQYTKDGKRCVYGPWTAHKVHRNKILLRDADAMPFWVRIVHVLEVLNQPRTLIQAFRDAQEVDRLKSELATMKQQRDSYGLGVMATRSFLGQSKTKGPNPQKSPTGQKANAFLQIVEQGASVDMNTVESWVAHAPQVLEGLEIKLAERKARVAEAEAAGPSDESWIHG